MPFHSVATSHSQTLLEGSMTADYLDVAFLVVLGFFAVRGLFRGLVEEIAGIVGVVGAFWVANQYSTEIAPFMSSFITDESWLGVACYVLVFLGVLIAVSLAARLIKRILDVSFVGWLDHAGGAAVGFIKGLFVCCIVLAVLQEFLSSATFVTESRVAPYLSQAADAIQTFLPEQFK